MDFFETVADKIAAGTEWGKQLGSQVAKQAATAGRTVRDGAAEAARQAGNAGRVVRNRAVEAAGAVRDKAVDVGRAARDRAEQAARAASDTARAGADWTRQKAGEAVDWSKQKSQQAVQAVSDGADWAKQKAGEGIDWGKEKGQQAVEAVGDGVDWAKKKAGEAVDWGKQKGKELDNWVAGGIASGVGNLATKNQTVERCIENMVRDKNRTPDPRDGQFMGNECPNTSPNPPKTGRLPQGCAGSAGKLPKIIYTNGINTPPEAACATMRQIANERCAEVIGVYNATYGTVEDALDSKNNIDRAGREPAAHSQARLLTEMLNKKPPQRVTMYSHSQGGLITQEGLTEGTVLMREKVTDNLIGQGMSRDEAKQEAARQTRKKMSQVDVYSFGTAEKEWPSVGAQYHQFTNTADPVPKLIGAVQNNRGLPHDPINLVERHRFTKNAWNPIDPHSMDSTYIPELNRVHPVPKKDNGQCC